MNPLPRLRCWFFGHQWWLRKGSERCLRCGLRRDFSAAAK